MNVIGQLNTLESAGLVRVAQVTPELEYLFRHTLVQDAAYASLLAEDQKRLHLEVGETLEQLYSNRLDELASTLASHFEKAGEGQRALKYYLKASLNALSSSAFQEAESYLRSALGLDPDEDTRLALLEDLGEALFGQSRYQEAIAMWEEAIQLFQACHDYEGVARLYARSARAAWFAGNTPEGLRISLEGLKAVVGAPEGPGLARLVHETARAYHFNGRPEEASMYCQQALRMAENLGDTEVLADTLTTLGILSTLSPDETLATLERAVNLAESASLLTIALRAHINLGSMTKSIKGDYQKARFHYIRSAELARLRGSAQEEFIPMMGLASLVMDMGELEEAEKIIANLNDLATRLPDPASAEIELKGLKAFLAGMYGDWEMALAMARECLAEATERGDLQHRVGYAHGILTISMELHQLGQPVDWDEVEAAISILVEMSQRGLLEPAVVATLTSKIRSHRGRLEEAHQQLAKARQEAVATPSIWMDLFILDAEALLAQKEKRWAEALRHYEALEKKLQQLNRWTAAQTLINWADVLLARGEAADLEQAQVLLLEAHEQFEKMGVKVYVKRVDERLAASRVQTYAQAVAQKKVAQELAFAGKLQGSFLPEEPPELPGWQMAIALKPVRETTGDFYDFIPLPDGKLGLAIADVADKGIGAALFMASTRSLLRAYSAEYPDHPEQVLAAANHRITLDTHGGLFITLFYGVLDPLTGRLIYCNAGHNPPYWFPTDVQAEAHALTRTGVPLGIFENATWETTQIQVQPGEALVLYTDGITEAQNQKQASFGVKGLLASVQKSLAQRNSQAQPAQIIRDTLLTDVWQFIGDSPQLDDITLMILLRK